MLGFGGGLAIVASSTWMAETVPVSQMGFVGTSCNLGCNAGLLISQLVQGFSLPEIDSEEAQTTDSYKVGFATPAVIAIVSMLFWQLYMQEDSLHHLIDQKQIERAKALHSRFFPTAAVDSFEALLQSRMQLKQESIQKPGYLDIFRDVKYRSFSWFLIFGAFFN
jgi:MFS family permease